MAELAEKIYGDALFQSALEENKLEQVKAELDALTAVFQAEPAFLAMMDSPAMDAGDKQKILKETFAGSVEEMLYNFLRILSDKRRMGLFLSIADQFGALYRQHLGLLEVEAVTAVAMSENQKQKLRDKLSELTGKQILLQNSVDASILGGVILKYNNQEINGSVREKLSALRHQIRGVIA